MSKNDFRNISQKTQDEIRKRAVKEVLSGKSQTETGKNYGVSRSTVCIWVNNFKKNGSKTLVSKKRGTHKNPKLTSYQASIIAKLIKDKHPEQLKLPFVLWTRESVRELIKNKFKITLSLTTIGRYLKKWGFTSQKPAKRAIERNDLAVQKWLNTEYPKIKKNAKKQKAEIFWGDETGLRSDHQSGKTYGIKGQTPIVKISAKRFSNNIISAMNNKGKFFFSVFNNKFNNTMFIRFLKRLIANQNGVKIFLIVDNYSVHKASIVSKFVEKNKKYIELFFLPTYSPELNPDEYLNQDLKANIFKDKRPRNNNEQTSMIRAKLRSIQKTPQKIINYFNAESVKYAAL